MQKADIVAAGFILFVIGAALIGIGACTVIEGESKRAKALGTCLLVVGPFLAAMPVLRLAIFFVTS